MIDQKTSRRGFFINMAQLTGAALLAPIFFKGVAKAEGALPLVDPKDGVASAVKYVEDAKKAKDAKGNTCANCGFYKKVEMRNGKEVGTCTIFAGKVVYGPGWCASWNKKA